MSLIDEIAQEVERQVNEQKQTINEMTAKPEEDTQAIIDGFAFYLDDGPVDPSQEEEGSAQQGPVIMAIGLADVSYLPELATIVRNGVAAFAKNRINPRLSKFYQQDLPMFPEGFMEYIDDIDMNKMNAEIKGESDDQE